MSKTFKGVLLALMEAGSLPSPKESCGWQNSMIHHLN